MDQRVKMREESTPGQPAKDDRCGGRCGRRPCSPLAGLLFLTTVASLASIAALLFWQPTLLSAGLAGVSKGPFVGAHEWVATASDWARGHAKPFWGGFGGAVFLLMVTYRALRQACCRRLFFFFTALATAPLAWTVVHSQWPMITELVRSVK